MNKEMQEKVMNLEEQFEVEGYNEYCGTSSQMYACNHDCIFDNKFYTSNA